MAQKPIYSTFKYYSKKGRRLNIFAMKEKRGSSGDSKDIFVIYVFECSEEDKFSKKFGRQRFDVYLRLASLGIEDTLKIKRYEVHGAESFTRWEFIEWCEHNFYKMREESFLFY